MVRRTKAEAQRTRESILDAAEDAFLERGVARASLAQIAARAHVTRGAIYWHFADKAALFDAMLERVQMPMVDLLYDIRAEADVRPFDGLRRLCLHAVQQLVHDARHRRVHTILFHRCESADEMADSEHNQQNVIDGVLASLQRYIGKLQQTGHVDPTQPPLVIARIIHIYMTGLYHDWLRNPHSYDIERDGMAGLDLLLDSLRRG